MKYKIGKTVAITLGKHKGNVVYDDNVPSFDIARRNGTNRMKWRRRGI